MRPLVFAIPLLSFFLCLVLPKPVLAVVDPLSVPNNKFGIHILMGTDEEASEAASLVNSNGGDWGYVTILIESDERKIDRWQPFFDNLRRRHLIPIVRIATQPDGNNWKVPSDQDAQDWANFLNSLNWPTQNRYVVVYNEPNQAHEWGGAVDATSYAKVLDQTITELKNKNNDFFVLNAGLDASAPSQPPNFEDEKNFIQEMDKTVPGIFNKLDGWDSHSYPNPNFSGSPQDSGRGSVKTYLWEKEVLKQLGVTKNLPVFITETGWKHAEGLQYDSSYPNADQVADYYKQAFQDAWNDSSVVAVTPFLLNYQESPFDHFSFKQITGEVQSKKILGVSYPPFYEPYFTLESLSKQAGSPIQDDHAQLTDGSIFASLVIGQGYDIPFQFTNTGQSIWTSSDPVVLKTASDSGHLNIDPVNLGPNQSIEPGGRAAFVLHIKGDLPGNYQISLQLYRKDKPMLDNPIQFTTDIKSPVKVQILSGLQFKHDFFGNYTLKFKNDNLQHQETVALASDGSSEVLEEKDLLPDQEYEVTISKPFYQSRTLKIKLNSGINQIGFGDLSPDFLAALTNPPELWQLLPFSG